MMQKGHALTSVAFSYFANRSLFLLRKHLATVDLVAIAIE